jgi:hypothetical protein
VVTLQLKSLLRRAELPPIRFHELRHTFATLHLAAGTNPKIVSEVLGHREVAITLDRYCHALPTLQAKAMGCLDAVLRRTPANKGARQAPGQGSASTLWLDKGPSRTSRAAKRPDPSVDQADEGEIGTAYRNRRGGPEGSG